MSKDASPSKVWNRGFILIFIANLFQHMGQQTITALIPKYANSMGAAASLVGIVSGAFAISALLSRPVTSPAFDCFKKKNLYSLSNIIILLAYLIFIVAPNVGWLIAGRLLQGIGVGICAPISLSIACDNLPEKSFSKGVSMFSLGQAFGQAIGPSIGLALSKSIGYKKTFIICFVMIFICLILSRFVFSNPPAEDAKYRIRLDTIIEKRAIPVALTITFVVIPYACISGFITIYADVIGIGNIGVYFTVYAVAILVLRFVTGGLADKLGYRTVLLTSLLCFAVTFVLFSVSRSITGFIVAAIFSALGYGIILPNMQALCMSSVPTDRRGVGSNTFFLFQDIGQFAGPYIGGVIVDSLIMKNSAPGAAEASTAVKLSAYSTMCLQDDKRLGFLWEEDYQNYSNFWGGDICYASLSLETITGGKFSMYKKQKKLIR